MLKYKMKFKAQEHDGFKVFYEELEKILNEQHKFLESVEFAVAVAEATDPVQACNLGDS